MAAIHTVDTGIERLFNGFMQAQTELSLQFGPQIIPSASCTSVRPIHFTAYGQCDRFFRWTLPSPVAQLPLPARRQQRTVIKEESLYKHDGCGEFSAAVIQSKKSVPAFIPDPPASAGCRNCRRACPFRWLRKACARARRACRSKCSRRDSPLNRRRSKL